MIPVKKRRANPEAEFQRQLVKWLRLVLWPDAIVHASVNEEKSARQAGINAGMGVFAGWPDLVVVAGGVMLFLELKSPTGRQSEAQREFQRRVEAQGFPYAVVRTLDEALGALRQSAIPTRIISGPDVPAHRIRLALPGKGPAAA